MIKLHDGEIKDIMPVNLITPEEMCIRDRLYTERHHAKGDNKVHEK